MQYAPKDTDRKQLESRPVLDDITVVIPTLGRSVLEESLRQIAVGSTWPARIIVVDQSSSRPVAAWLACLNSLGLETEHLPSSQRGKAAALNRGIERVKTRFVAITDDDCLVERGWLENMRRHLRENSNAIVTGPAYATGAETPVAVVSSRKFTVSRHPGLKFDLFCGSNVGATLAAIQRVGWFDEDPCFVSAAEDCDWAYRALRAGVPIIYVPEVAVYHIGWRDADQRSSRYRLYARGHGSFYGKYLLQGDWLIAIRVMIHHLRALKRWLAGILTGDREQILYGRAYLTGLLAGIIARIRRGCRT